MVRNTGMRHQENRPYEHLISRLWATAAINTYLMNSRLRRNLAPSLSDGLFH